MKHDGEYMIADTCIILRNRFPGWIGKKLMMLCEGTHFWRVGSKRVIGPERDRMAAAISKIDMSPYLQQEEE